MSEIEELAEKRATEAAHNFCHWWEHNYGSLPYGIHRSLKALYLDAVKWREGQVTKPEWGSVPVSLEDRP